MKSSNSPLQDFSPDFSRAEVLVVGDVMLDRYWMGATVRISPEAPVPVVRIEGTEVRPGGAANVALNVAALGAGSALVGVVGQDDAADELRAVLVRGGVDLELIEDPALTTTTKLRVVSRQQQLLRLDFEASVRFDPTKFLDKVRTAVARFESGGPLIILSDYGKGALGENATLLIEYAAQLGYRVLVDPKGGDFTHYRGAHILTPNLAEFEAIAGPCSSESSLEKRARALRKELDVSALLVTRGSAGMSLFTSGEVHHYQAHAHEVFDVTGAGDTVIAALGTALAAGCGLPEATQIANLAASVAVSKFGTATVSSSELRESFGKRQNSRGVVSYEDALACVADAKEAGQTVVMTNGCFDILHAGHVQALRQAASFGDRLLVAVNDDASVARLKGDDRPIVPLAQRMQILAALESVDWVVSFPEDAPSRLVRAISPDVLAKGSDYQLDEIAGASYVLSTGGTVERLSYVPGVSTTRMVDAIRDRGKPE